MKPADQASDGKQVTQKVEIPPTRAPTDAFEAKAAIPHTGTPAETVETQGEIPPTSHRPKR